MSIFPLELFPQGSLASSVITTVWVGVAVVAFFNLRFGWVLSGLVVPGYMVPLLLIKPWAAGVVFFEGFVTYFLVWWFFEAAPRLGYWNSLFGRDRFFALVLVSVLVRIVCDAWLLPGLGEWVTSEYGVVFDYRSNLHSFGLVIIALIANQFWKTGIIRGVLPMAITVGVTYLIVRYGLMTVTNFTVSNLGYMYEDIAASILASPKAYIVLLTVAFVASRMNLLYGWDYSGILIPSLLALMWYEPTKVLITFFEALLILFVARGLMQTRWLRNSNIEGARQLVLFFNIGFVYKLLLGYLILKFYPATKITDAYAFGYLLATLMAMKMYDKDIAARLTRATLQTSLVGVTIASLVGFVLTLLPLGQLIQPPLQGVAVSSMVRLPEQQLQQQLRNDKLLLYQPRETGHVTVPLTSELQIFSDAIAQLKKYLRKPEPARLETVARQLAAIGYEVLLVGDRYVYLREAAPARGWGLYVINIATDNRLVVEVPVPMDERGTLESAIHLFVQGQAGALAIAGASRYINADASADVLLNRQTLFHVFHRNMARHNALQVRGYSGETTRVLAGMRRKPGELDLPELTNTLWVQSELPPGLDLPGLKKQIGGLDVEWRSLPFSNRQQEVSRRGFAELMLNRSARRTLRARSIKLQQELELQVAEQRIDGYLQEWLLSGRNRIASRGSDLYQAPQLDELLYFDEEILTPLFAAIRTGYSEGEWTPEGLQDIYTIQQAAALFDYRLLRYRHRQTGEDFLILFERDDAGVHRYWGSYVFRLGPADAYVVQVPRPLYEYNSYEYGVSLFEHLQARALLIAGAHPDANRDGSADLVRMDHYRSLFSLVNQVMLRESGADPMLVIHSRAFGYRPDLPPPVADVLVSFTENSRASTGPALLVDRLVARLDSDGLQTTFVNGSLETAGYEVGNVPQSLYLDATQNKGFAVLWLSPGMRSSFRQQTDNRQEAVQFHSLGILTVEAGLSDYILEQPGAVTRDEVPAALRASISHYQDIGDIVTLRRLQYQWPDFRMQRVIDRDTRQSFLFLFDRNDGLRLVANLHPHHTSRAIAVSVSQPDAGAITQFIDSRAAWLEFEA